MLHTNFPSQRVLTALLFTAALLAPMTVAAYLLPEEVLMNENYYAPPTAREADLYQSAQMKESARRREAEWEAEYARQHPPEPEVVVVEEEDTHAAAGETGTMDLELLRTIRLLERVDARQDVLEDLWTLPTMHQGAPLSPTGPASVLAAMTMLSAMGWTLKSASKKKGWSKRKL